MSAGSVAEVFCRNVLFVHWPIKLDQIRPVVPAPLSIDTYGESAWISILVVNIPEAKILGVPSRPSLVSINLRTYVSYENESGVYFISLETEGQLSTWLARNGFGLPYHHASIESGYRNGAHFVTSKRDRSSEFPVRFAATYQPDSNANPVQASYDSREEFLIERDNYFFVADRNLRRTLALFGTSDVTVDPLSTSDTDSSLVVGHAPHDPWSLIPVEATINNNTLFEAAGIPTPSSDPVFNYAPQQIMRASELRELSII